METVLRHWLFHFEWPHAQSEWASEASQMMHDHFFWGTMAVLVGTVFLVGWILWGMTPGTPIVNPPTVTPISWPFPYTML
jgi:hypothetical protein